MAQTQAQRSLEQAIHDQATGQCHEYTAEAADQLTDHAHPAQATQARLGKDPAGDPAPHSANAMQWPDAENVVDFPAVLRSGETPDEQPTSHYAGEQRAKGMHQVGAGTDGYQSCQRTVMQKTRVIASGQQRCQGAAHHCHQRIDRHQATDPLQALRAHDVEAEPADDQDPRAQREKRNARGSKGDKSPVTITPTPCAKQQHRCQG